MRTLGKMIAHIPARGGSKRVPAKNLRFLGDKPLIGYAIETAVQSRLFDDIYVNSDSAAIAALAKTYGIQAYQRPAHLGSDTATGDDFTADFLKNVTCDTLVMISPVCPLVTTEDIRSAIHAYSESDCDTLITCESTQMQTFCNDRAVNIDASAPLAPSQKNEVVKILNWAVTIWDSRTFLNSYQQNNNGYLGTQRKLYPLDPMHCLKISHESDFAMAELLLAAQRNLHKVQSPPRYWNLTETTSDRNIRS